VSDAANKYTYNTSNQLVNVSNRVAGSTSYLFDPLGQRVAKLTSGSNVTYFTYDIAGRLIGEYNHSQSTEYVWMGNSPVAVLKKNGDDPAQLYTIHTDHLGTPRQVTNAVTNEVVWEWSGEPFGTNAPNEDLGHTGKFTLNLRYAGQYYDQESNLFHNGFRDYNPQIGRYVQSDPIGLAGGINTYTYVNGNPLTYTDPSGLFPMYECWGGANWSSCQSGANIPTNPSPPKDAYDACYAQHDYCYAKRDAPVCSMGNKPKTSDCDATLSACLEAARDAGNKPTTWWGYPFIPASDAWAIVNGRVHKRFGD
jgi:RHS repeat-associated protein